MNKQLKKAQVPLGILAALAVFGGLSFYLINPVISDFMSAKTAKEQAIEEERRLAEEDQRIKSKTAQEEMKIKSLKTIYESNFKSSVANLGIFGTMFEDIITRVQTAGLMIRAIEYDLKPASDVIFQKFEAKYNVCELKFFLVGTYSQLQTFLVDLNNTFPYLVSVSKIDVEAFANNTDYLLIDLSVNLYSKKK